MKNSKQNNGGFEDLDSLIELIRRGDCVLVLGPRVAIRANDPEGPPLDERLACELWNQGSKSPPSSINLHRAAECYYNTYPGFGRRTSLETRVRDFYKHEAGSTTDFHRHLARLPFRLCISASPDNLMLNAFKDAKKLPQKGYYHYHFKPKQSHGGSTPASGARLSPPTVDRPLVYYLSGHYEDPQSLVLTEGDLIEFLVAIISRTPAIPDVVRHILASHDAAFLFLGFGFHNWYLRVLLHVMEVYGHPNIAFEDETFFKHPEHEQTVGFFSGDRLIHFRPLRWDKFAQQLCEEYDATDSETFESTSVSEPLSLKAPKAFISYADEDRAAVKELTEELGNSGIKVWQDKQDLRAGDDWNRVLLDVIAKRVDYVIVLQTQAMTTRVSGVFNREIKAALKRHDEMGEFEGQKFRFLIPVKVGVCATLSSLKDLHVIDIEGPRDVGSLAQSIFEDWDSRAKCLPRPEEDA